MPHPRKSRIVELLVAADPLDARANFYSRQQLAAGVARFLFELEKRLPRGGPVPVIVGVHSVVLIADGATVSSSTAARGRKL